MKPHHYLGAFVGIVAPLPLILFTDPPYVLALLACASGILTLLID